jgi:hypothetical protein
MSAVAWSQRRRLGARAHSDERGEVHRLVVWLVEISPALSLGAGTPQRLREHCQRTAGLGAQEATYASRAGLRRPVLRAHQPRLELRVRREGQRRSFHLAPKETRRADQDRRLQRCRVQR